MTELKAGAPEDRLRMTADFHRSTGIITPYMIGRIDVPLIRTIADIEAEDPRLSVSAFTLMWVTRGSGGGQHLSGDEVLQNIIRSTPPLPGPRRIRPEDVKSWNRDERKAYLEAVWEAESKAAGDPPNITARQPVGCLLAGVLTEANWKLLPAHELAVWAAGWGVQMDKDPYQTVLNIISLQNGIFREIMAAGHGAMAGATDSFLTLVDPAADPDYQMPKE